MLSLDDLQAIRARAEATRDEVNRSKGAYGALMTRLRDEYDCETLEQAKEKLAHLRDKAKKLEEKALKAKKEFEDAHPELRE